MKRESSLDSQEVSVQKPNTIRHFSQPSVSATQFLSVTSPAYLSCKLFSPYHPGLLFCVLFFCCIVYKMTADLIRIPCWLLRKQYLYMDSSGNLIFFHNKHPLNNSTFMHRCWGVEAFQVLKNASLPVQ